MIIPTLNKILSTVNGLSTTNYSLLIPIFVTSFTIHLTSYSFINEQTRPSNWNYWGGI